MLGDFVFFLAQDRQNPFHGGGAATRARRERERTFKRVLLQIGWDQVQPYMCYMFDVFDTYIYDHICMIFLHLTVAAISSPC